MAKTGRVCDFTGEVFAEGSVGSGTIVCTLYTKDNPLGLVTTYDVSTKGMQQATADFPEGSTRAKFKRKTNETDAA